MKVIWTNSAKSDVLDFLNVLKKENPLIMNKWKQKIGKVGIRLQKFPEMGGVSKNPNYREIIFSPFKILYRIEGEFVFIVAFIHTRRFFCL